MHLQQIPLVAALEQAHATLWEADEIVFRFLQLKQVHIKSLVDRATVEDELMWRDREQRLGQLSDAIPVKVLQILRGHDEVGLFLSNPFQDVADVLDDGGPHRDVNMSPPLFILYDLGSQTGSAAAAWLPNITGPIRCCPRSPEGLQTEGRY